MRTWNTCHVEPSAPVWKRTGRSPSSARRCSTAPRRRASTGSKRSSMASAPAACSSDIFALMPATALVRSGPSIPKFTRLSARRATSASPVTSSPPSPTANGLVTWKEKTWVAPSEPTRRAVLVAGAERRGRVDDERDARRVTRGQPRLADGRGGRGTEGGGGQHAGHPVALLGQYPRELGRVELPRRGVDVDEQGHEARPRDGACGGREGEGRHDDVSAAGHGVAEGRAQGHHESDRAVGHGKARHVGVEVGAGALVEQLCARATVGEAPGVLAQSVVRGHCVQRRRLGPLIGNNGRESEWGDGRWRRGRHARVSEGCGHLVPSDRLRHVAA